MQVSHTTGKVHGRKHITVNPTPDLLRDPTSAVAPQGPRLQPDPPHQHIGEIVLELPFFKAIFLQSLR